MTRALPEIPVPELSALVRAVRGGASTARNHKDLRAAAAAFLVILATLLHSAGAAAWNSREAHSRASHEESKMKFSARGVMVASALAVSSGAVAQNAVQWRVQDGGNGHWYQLHDPFIASWFAARDQAVSRGGHLVTLTSQAEQSFAASVAFSSTPDQQDNCWLGGFQDPTSPSFAEPASGWRWVTGEPWDFTAWRISSGEPNGPGEFLAATTLPNEGLRWVDGNPQHQPGNCQAFIEWSADCNNDGIVDYGQIRAGEILDANGNNIPDCCEQGAPCPNPLLPVEWRVVDGGNGHWYGLRIDPLVPTAEFNARCGLVGGHLASITTPQEHQFVLVVMLNQNWLSRTGWPAIGLRRQTASSSWAWVTGEAVSYTPWATGEPGASGLFAQLWGTAAGPNLTWSANGNPFISAGVIEYDADCNADGIVDYGQIRTGELADTNANNIPDCCEGGQSCNTCSGDVDNSGAVNGVDLAAVLGNWGTNGGKYPGTDTNHDGVVNGIDLAVVLGGWGLCP